MFCQYCGKDIPDQAVFCSYCGKHITNNASGDKIDADSLLSKGKATFNQIQEKVEEKLGVDESAHFTHPYRKLGGWLAWFTYGWLICGIFLLLDCLKLIVSMLTAKAMLGGILGMVTGPAILIAVIIYLFGAAICAGMFVLIQKRDSRFMRYFEIVGIMCIAGVFVVDVLLTFYSKSMLGNFDGFIVKTLWLSSIPIILELIVFFVLMLLYYRKSVRVRTYFRTDAYLRWSIFSKNAPSPKPAIPDGE